MSDILEMSEDGYTLKVPEGGWREDHFRLMIKGKEEFECKVTEYVEKRYRADPEWTREFRHEPDIDRITCEGATVEVECSATACSRGCCGDDVHTYRFPLSHLWLDQTSILADIKAEADAKKKAKAIADAKEQEAARIRQEASERRRLAELLKKYPEEVKNNG